MSSACQSIYHAIALMGRDCALSYPLETVTKQLKEGACRAVHNICDKSIPPLKVKTPLEIAIKFFDNGYFKSRFQNLSLTPYIPVL